MKTAQKIQRVKETLGLVMEAIGDGNPNHLELDDRFLEAMRTLSELQGMDPGKPKPEKPLRQKIVYIAHPIGGDVKNNLRKITGIAREINLAKPDIVPFVPYFIDLHALKDDIVDERKKGMDNNRVHFERRTFDELWLFGPKISKGMHQEILLAIRHGIAIRPMSEATSNEFKELREEMMMIYEEIVLKKCRESEDQTDTP